MACSTFFVGGNGNHLTRISVALSGKNDTPLTGDLLELAEYVINECEKYGAATVSYERPFTNSKQAFYYLSKDDPDFCSPDNADSQTRHKSIAKAIVHAFKLSKSAWWFENCIPLFTYRVFNLHDEVDSGISANTFNVFSVEVAAANMSTWLNGHKHNSVKIELVGIVDVFGNVYQLRGLGATVLINNPVSDTQLQDLLKLAAKSAWAAIKCTAPFGKYKEC